MDILYQYIARIAPGRYGLWSEWDNGDQEGLENKFKVMFYKEEK